MRVYPNRSFWIVKILMIFFGLIVLWNVAKESGREEMRQTKLISEAPFCMWSGVVYSATEIDTKRMIVKIKRGQ